jgi:hypothetical protein
MNKEVILRSLSRAGLILKKYSPEIFTGLSISSTVAAVVSSAKASSAAKDAYYLYNIQKVQMANEFNAGNGEYGKNELEHDTVLNTVDLVKRMVMIYGPTAGFLAVSISAQLAAFGLLKNRSVAYALTLKLLQEQFNTYRDNIVDNMGLEKDAEAYLGKKIEEETVTERDETGAKVRKKKYNLVNAGSPAYSIYSRYFDESSPHWQPDSSLNLFYLRSQERYLNDILRARGHVFLNEAYDCLGLPHTKEGAIVGWILPDVTDDTGPRDGYISFGLYDPTDERKRAFVNGFERSILVDPNVDGITFDLI